MPLTITITFEDDADVTEQALVDRIHDAAVDTDVEFDFDVSIDSGVPVDRFGIALS